MPVSGNGNATAVHNYSAPGIYAVRLSFEGVAPVSVSVRITVPTPTLGLAPNPANVKENVTASLGNLAPNFGYSLDWGDGTTAPISGNGNASATHKYAAPGVFVVKLTPDGLPPVTSPLTVKVPAPTLDAQPNPARVGQMSPPLPAISSPD